MVLFGGYGDGVVSMGETWVYDPADNNWTNMNPAVSPPKRHAPIAIYDSHADRIIMFGGVDPWKGGREDHFNDTWSYDLNTNTWIELFPDGSPSKRQPQIFVYIPSIDKSLLTGGWLNFELGIDNGEPYNDSWLYDYTNNTWTEIPSNFPIQGLWGAFTFNNIDNTCYLYDFNQFKIRKGEIVVITQNSQALNLLHYAIINTNSVETGISNNILVISLIFIGISITRSSSKPKRRVICR
jgi:N-acetylneuraminic acid mutarotase